MAMKRKMSKNLKRILFAFALNMALIIATFSVATFAWFSMNTTVGVGGASFSVKAPDSIQFDLYYLQSFVTVEDETEVSKYGNLNKFGFDDEEDPEDVAHWSFTGYQKDYVDSNFVKINLNSNGECDDDPSPMDIEHLWPAHRLTYALAVKGSKASSFKLDSWDETRISTRKAILENEDEVEVSLSWAINMYGHYYNFTKQAGDTDENIKADIEKCYKDNYHSYLNPVPPASAPTDTFVYDEESTEHSVSTLVDNIAAPSDGQRTIIFFTIEFSNDNSTFYVLDKTTGKYSKGTSGNSNCYENLTLTGLSFSLT